MNFGNDPTMTKTRLGHASAVLLLSASVGLLSACTSSSTTSRSAVDVSTKKRPKEYFAESVYGVKASPRVTNKRSRLQRGGGRDQIGKPYQVRGKWYYPKEQPGYSKVGMASWYGDAFHGRLTANGEIYDMTHLTGAHPTMPLPSYARVTNTANGASVIVRINDRGPYHDGRVVDLSHKAAEMLGYINDGTARVKVDYVGRAPLDGQDERYLVASYMPGKGPLDPSVGMPTGVMVAMNGRTPGSRPEKQSLGQLTVSDAAGDLQGVALPDNGPPVLRRPEGVALASMSYAPTSNESATAFDSLIAPEPSKAEQGITAEYVLVGSFASRKEAEAIRLKLRAYGKALVEASRDGAGKRVFTLTVRADSTHSSDEILQAAWAAGAADALTVRE